MESRLFFLMLKMSLELLLGLQPVSIDIQRDDVG
jgi:hypothetical protein